ncbi:Envelope glycoprotein, partial [Lemmus lemmus]
MLIKILTSSWLWLLLIRACNIGGTPSQYQLFNFTWQVINKAGDIAYSSSTIASTPPWNPIKVDLCKLVMGGHPNWGVSDKFLPLEKAPGLDPPEEPIHYSSPGCNSASRRIQLATDGPNSRVYVCPGGHRPRESGLTCGHYHDYFCKSWGCETTGDTYWKPSSTWDLITVTRQFVTHPSASCLSGSQEKGWCNPLIISFTERGKSYNWENSRGAEWGLRLYKNHQDY